MNPDKLILENQVVIMEALYHLIKHKETEKQLRDKIIATKFIIESLV